MSISHIDLTCLLKQHTDQYFPGIFLWLKKQDGLKALCGALGGSRTHDPRLRKPILYPSELRARCAETTLRLADILPHPAPMSLR